MRRLPVDANIFERMEDARERWNVLNHPFYERWSAGELTTEALARYAGQYRHAVAAIATMSESVAAAHPERADLAVHAAAEREHIELWDSFADALGAKRDAEPTPETAACVEEWTGGDPLSTLARLYAIESGQPAISRTKLEGLQRHYDMPGGRATGYFTVHQTLDSEHAAEGRALLEELGSVGREDELVAAAEGAMRANWLLLDGV
jgi:pyrroloquinoline-quinone synthase